jgi:hypothetical protein
LARVWLRSPFAAKIGGAQVFNTRDQYEDAAREVPVLDRQ